MSYNFKPLTEEEINTASLVPDGIYNFEVLKTERGISKKGNDKATINIRFWDDQGKTHTLLDWLVFAEIPLCIRKVKHFCDSVGLQEEYKRGTLLEEFGGLSGKAKIVTKTGEDGITRNVIEDYLPMDKKPLSIQNTPNIELNDDVPF